MAFRQILKPTLALHEGKIDDQFEMIQKSAKGKVLGQSKSGTPWQPRICSRRLVDCGSLRPSIYADVRYIDDVIAIEGLGRMAAKRVQKMSSDAFVNGGMVDMLLKGSEAALTGDEQSESESESSSSSSMNTAIKSSSASRPESFTTLGGLVQGLTHPKLSKAVNKPGASGSPGTLISCVCLSVAQGSLPSTIPLLPPPPAPHPSLLCTLP